MKEKFEIPFSKPDISEEEIEAVLNVLKTGWPSQGKITVEFQNLLSNYLSSNVSVVNNGSSALTSALIANGVKPGDKVIVPAFTYVATASIPKILGANVLVGDIDLDTLNMTPDHVEKLVKNNDIKAIISVDVAGLPSDIDGFIDIAKRNKIKLIEDAAQAFGSEYKNKKIGSFEHTTIFSFQITKQITTIEGGCVATTDENIIKKINKIKDYGRSENGRYVHDFIGTNFRTTDLQSAIGKIQLKKIEKHVSTRIQIAKEFISKIKGVDFQLIPNYVTRHSYLIFFALAKNSVDRDEFIKNLIKNDIDARKAWVPIHRQPCFPELQNFTCKNAENVYDRAFTLPLYNSMTLDESNLVINNCRKD